MHEENLISIFLSAHSVTLSQILARFPDVENFALDHYNQDNGLSQGSVYAIAGYDEYMWFETQDGLNRFDWYNFKVYQAGTKCLVENEI